MAAIFSSFSHFYPSLLVFCFLHSSLLTSSTDAGYGGFTVDLIHRDSPLSPFYNPSSTSMDRLNDAFRRSISRAAHFKPTSKPANGIQSEIIPASGAYLMKLSIGTPHFEILGFADTGSDLTWTQCKPCKQCFKQKNPLFDPNNSSTYKHLSCNSQPCKSLGTFASCHAGEGICKYAMLHGDFSYSNGDLAVDTFTFGSTSGSGRSISFPKMVLGCGHDNDGSFDEAAAGIIGLGGGNVSLVNQLAGSINGKFSYCLLPNSETGKNVTSKINFGSNAIVSGSGVVSTPLVTKKTDTFHYLVLKDVSVGNKTLAYQTPSKSKAIKFNADEEEGNIIIDSGTPLTFLPDELYTKLESAVKRSINGKPVQQPPQPLSLCYKAEDNVDIPKMTFHFSGGADLELPPSSTFIKYQGLVCLAMTPADDVAIFGNLSQTNFLIGSDLGKNEISFKPTDCTKH